VSVVFGFVHAFFAVVFYGLRARHWPLWTMLMGVFAIMEWEQAAQWYWGDVLPLENFFPVPTSCTKRNAAMSFVGWLFLFFQPLVVALGAYLSFDEKRRTYFVFPTLYMIFSILMGIKNYDFDPTDTPTGIDIPGTNFGRYSCTYIGPNGHLLWKWAFFDLEHIPNFNDYAATVLVSIALYPLMSFAQIMIFFGFSLTYFVGWFYMGWVEELPSFWCYVSVVAALPAAIGVVEHFLYGKDRKSDTVAHKKGKTAKTT